MADMERNERSSHYFELDRERFHEQSVAGEKGYYDMVEKIFIPERILRALIMELSPELSSSPQNILERSQSRIAQNLERTRFLDKDSYAQIYLMHMSHKFLLQHKNIKDHMAILYIDLVGSTALSAALQPAELAIIVRVFCQEMSIMISKHKGYVLKYAGDAVIGYFPKDPDIRSACENAVKCAYHMRLVIKDSINVVLFQKKYPKLRARIAVDAGENQIVVLGYEPDLLGHVISRAAKIMGKANPNQIVIGGNVFRNISEDLRKKFLHTDSYVLEAGEGYPVYLSLD